jgi:prolyl-tRNA editing enzyme YbaK/EbsC (Cys-tRNA(Pro) deacylase)
LSAPPDLKADGGGAPSPRVVADPTDGPLPPVDFENPGSWLRRFKLNDPVVSCESAAAAKGVGLGHELKTLVFEADLGLALAHLRGDRRLSLRAVKRCVPTRQAKLASVATLASLGVEPGTVTPFHPLLWGLPHVISRDVLDLNWVTTNAGVRDEYVVFDPVLLLRARDTRVARLWVEP